MNQEKPDLEAVQKRIGHELKAVREAAGLTLNGLSREAGIDSRTIKATEEASKQVLLTSLVALLQALKLDPNRVMLNAVFGAPGTHPADPDYDGSKAGALAPSPGPDTDAEFLTKGPEILNQLAKGREGWTLAAKHTEISPRKVREWRRKGNEGIAPYESWLLRGEALIAASTSEQLAKWEKLADTGPAHVQKDALKQIGIINERWRAEEAEIYVADDEKEQAAKVDFSQVTDTDALIVHWAQNVYAALQKGGYMPGRSYINPPWVSYDYLANERGRKVLQDALNRLQQEKALPAGSPVPQIGSGE